MDAVSVCVLSSGVSSVYHAGDFTAGLQIELIRYHGYPAQSHEVQTRDGYILGVQRIPPPSDNQSRMLDSLPLSVSHVHCTLYILLCASYLEQIL